MIASDHKVYKYENGEWGEPLGSQLALNITVDAAGSPWIVSIRHTTFQWTDNTWVARSLHGAHAIAASPTGAIFSTSYPAFFGDRTVYSWQKNHWTPVEQAYALSVAVGSDG